MFDSFKPSTQKLNRETYRDKVLGCWTGKNIGGTMGTPFEGRKEMNDATFYTHKLDGNPLPNDDLDLQLIWLLAAEENGIYHLNERILGEYWLTHISGPWNEYGVCKSNIRNGLIPPLSGSCNNDVWKYSNGAWIRSEVWACIFPGSPHEAAQFAYYDSACDHCGEGIYAELFTATLESAAFVVNDIRELINIGLSMIPADCRIAQSVNLACEYYDKGKDFIAAREAMVKDSEDLGWFQAPANIGYTVIGLLYGEGDFGKTICIATNCGDDTDCTAGTAGAILGIMYGRSGIPEKWIEPIGESIQTCSIDTYGRNNQISVPKSLDELTDRVMEQAVSAQFENRTLPQFTDGQTEFSDDYIASFKDSKQVEKRIWDRSPYGLAFDLPYGEFTVDYQDGPEVIPGEPKVITLKMDHVRFIEKVVSVRLMLPESWQAMPCDQMTFTAKHSNIAEVEMTIVPGEFSGSYYYLPIEIKLCDRFNPVIVHAPFQRKGSVKHFPDKHYQGFWDASNRLKSRFEK